MRRSNFHLEALLVFLIFGFLAILYFTHAVQMESVRAITKYFNIDEYRSSYDEMRRLMNEQRDGRVTRLRKIYVENNSSSYATLYNVIVPEVYCPSLLRIGNVDDGGKWMCRPHALPKGCAIYSLGVNGDSTFEREIQKITEKRCKVHSFDKDMYADTVKGFSEINADFTVALVSNVDNSSTKERNIKTLMRDFGDDSIEVLKIDIEGSEFKVMPMLLNSVKMCQILIEIHGPAVKAIKLINEFGSGGYRLFSYEINGAYHQLSEYSFIHESCMEQYSAKPLAFYWHLVQ